MRAIEQLGRLGPHGVRWEGVRGGGGPVIGRDEILDALASVGDPVGQALLLLTARAGDKSHVKLVQDAAWTELDRQYEIELQRQAAEALGSRRQLIAASRSRRVSPKGCHRGLADRGPQRWPDWERTADRYERLIPACIKELTFGPIACLECRGSPTVPAESGEGITICPKCNGTGLHPNCPRERGEALTVSRVAYQKTWAPVWEHLARHLANAMQNAAAEFDARIRANVRDAAA